MSEQTTGRHLSQQPSGARKGQPKGKTAQPVSTARRAGAARPVDTARSADTPRPVDTAWTADEPRPAARPRPAAGGEQTVAYAAPSGPEGPSGDGGGRRGRGKPRFDLFVRIFVLVLLFASMAALALVLARTEMLTGKLLLVICGLLLVIFAIVAVLMFVLGKNRLPWGMIVTSLLLTAVMATVSVLGHQGTETLRNITDSHTYTASRISVYVRDDDPAQSLEEIAGYTFGIMQSMSHEGVDKAISDLNARLGTSIRTVGFDTPTGLVSALFDGSVDAVITDSSFIEGLQDLETYGDLVKRMKEVSKMHVQVAQPTQEPAAEEPEEDDHVYSILITGIDSRNGLVRSSLSDVNILATVNTDTRQVLLISTPRDYKVVFSNTGVADKLTHAGWYGEEVCMGTIGDLYDMDIDYYFRINFEGFVNIIDALGGITVNSPMEFDSQNVRGYHFDAGEIHLDGENALVFVRERKVFADGDAQRGENQLEVIRGVVKKVMSTELLANYSSLLTAVEGSFETTVPYDLIASLIRRQLDDGGDWNIVSYSVTGEGTHEVSPALGEEVYMTIPDEASVQTAKDMIAQVTNDEILTGEGLSIGT